MKKIMAISGLLLCAGVMAQSQDKLQAGAMRGDYQAQRNLAYSYAAPMKGETGDKIKACAWYLVILQSGSSKINAGDTSNADTYCTRLSKMEQLAANSQATELVKQIYQR